MVHILVVEDDYNTRKLMEAVLQSNGFMPFLASNGEDALDVLDKYHIDLMIVDVMMPKMDGFELTNVLRESEYQLPILMVTAKEDLSDKKKGFNLGVDDYMVKPVNEEEMLLRINALLRRSKIANDHLFTIGSTVLNADEFTVTCKDSVIELPQKEFLLLNKLISYQNRIFTRNQLMDEIWGPESDSDLRTIDVHINRLRDRFKNNEDFQIVTIRGLGYKAVVNK